MLLIGPGRGIETECYRCRQETAHGGGCEGFDR